MQQKAPGLLVMYASQTGNAEWIAKSIDEEALNKGYKSRCLVMDQFEQAQLENERVVVIVSSTTGDGDSPDNALKWWRHYRKLSKANPNAFSHMQIAVLGIGDTNYSNFGAHPKKLDKKFQDLGAQSFYPILIADEVEGLESQIDPWIAGLWQPLSSLVECGVASPIEETIVKDTQELHLSNSVDFAYKLPIDFMIPSELSGLAKVPAQKCRLEIDGSIESHNPWSSSGTLSEYTQLHPFEAKVVNSRCLTKEGSVKRTIELQIDLAGMNWTYVAGDAVGVWAPNNERLVNGMLQVLGLKPDSKIIVEPINKSDEARQLVPSHLPDQLQAADLFRYFVDLTGFPRKAFFRCMAEYATDHKSELMYLSSRQGADDLKKLMALCPTVLDLLVTFNVQLPLHALVDNLLPLQPRYYSACSSGGSLMNIAFNVVDYQVQDMRRLGVASVHLDQLTMKPTLQEWTLQNQTMYVFPRPSKDFVVPQQVPVIMIGAGTGVSPFIGFLQELRGQGRQSWLFQGCRSSTLDFLFKPDIMEFIDDGTLTRCNVSTSREVAPHSDQVKYGGKYVQDALKSEGRELMEWMSQRQASIYICGDANGFAQQVQSTIIELIQTHLAQDQPESMLTFADWVRSKRYVRDIW